MTGQAVAAAHPRSARLERHPFPPPTPLALFPPDSVKLLMVVGYVKPSWFTIEGLAVPHVELDRKGSLEMTDGVGRTEVPTSM